MTSPPDDAPGLTGGGATFLKVLTISVAQWHILARMGATVFTVDFSKCDLNR